MPPFTPMGWPLKATPCSARGWRWLVRRTALVGAKVLAASCGILLYMVGFYRGLAYLTVFYAVAAIGPWLFVLQHY